MLTRLKTYFKQGTSFAGLEIYELQGNLAYEFLLLKKKKGSLDIVASKHLSNPEELQGLLKTNVPLVLVINTADVLIKKIEAAKDSPANALVDAAFPNLNLDNFYFEAIQHHGEATVAIAKKEVVEGFLARIKALKLQVTNFSLGISTLPQLLPFLEPGELVLSNYKTLFENGSLSALQPLEEIKEVNYSLNGLRLTNKQLLTFSGILTLLGKHFPASNFENLNSSALTTFENNRIFSLLLKGSLIFFLTLLLVNFLAFDFYFGKAEELKAVLEVNNSSLNDLKDLEVSVNKKQERVELLSAASNSKATFFLDQLAQKVPKHILLEKITYQPLDKPLREGKPLTQEERNILIGGTSADGDAFSKWIVTLEKLDWTTAVETLDYDYISSSTSRFLIKISFHEK